MSEEDFHGPGLQLGKIVLEGQVEILQTVGLLELAGQLTGAQPLEFSHLDRGLWIRIDLMRIRIQFQIQGFDDQKLK